MTLLSDARAIFNAGVAAVEPGRAVARWIRRTDRGVWIGSRRLARPTRRSVYVLSVGKAAAAMADAAAAQLGSVLAGGLVVQRPEDPRPRHDWTLRFGSHPLPSGASERAARSAMRALQELPREVALLVLLSGGGSAIFEWPAEGLSIDDLRRTYALLIGSGAPIQSINTVRRHLSRVKGGWLAVAAGPRPLATLAISDVVGDTAQDIASGPTVPDPSTFREALAIVRRWSLKERLPPRVLAHLEAGRAGRVRETPKPADPRFRGSTWQLVATNRIALEGCAAEARSRGYRTRITSSDLTGETQPVARDQVRKFGRYARPRIARPRPPLAFLSGGETTVRLGSNPGRGGRNQEFALAAAQVCDGWSSVAVLSAGTDGIDGPTDAAGGLVTGETAARARRQGIRLAQVLARHDAYPALQKLGALVVTGPTGTNVMDLHLLLAGKLPSRPDGRTPSRRGPRTRLGSVPASR
jgi:glycerate 2-kinase